MWGLLAHKRERCEFEALVASMLRKRSTWVYQNLFVDSRVLVGWGGDGFSKLVGGVRGRQERKSFTVSPGAEEWACPRGRPALLHYESGALRLKHSNHPTYLLVCYVYHHLPPTPPTTDEPTQRIAFVLLARIASWRWLHCFNGLLASCPNALADHPGHLYLGSSCRTLISMLDMLVGTPRRSQALQLVSLKLLLRACFASLQHGFAIILLLTVRLLVCWLTILGVASSGAALCPSHSAL